MSELHCSGSLRLGRVPGYPRYRVLSSGSIWYRRGNRMNDSLGPWRRRRTYRDPGGYLCISLTKGDHCSGGAKRTFCVHTLILLAFVGPRPVGKQCRHLDGDTTNNRLENLSWGTCEEQHADKWRHGTAPVGSRRNQAKLTEADVVEIRRRATKRGDGRKLAREFGVSPILISNVVNRKVWRHVS